VFIVTLVALAVIMLTGTAIQAERARAAVIAIILLVVFIIILLFIKCHFGAG
jgi:hypothetical protein